MLVKYVLSMTALYYGEDDSFLDQSNVFAYIIFIFALLNTFNGNCFLQTIMIGGTFNRYGYGGGRVE